MDERGMDEKPPTEVTVASVGIPVELAEPFSAETSIRNFGFDLIETCPELSSRPGKGDGLIDQIEKARARLAALTAERELSPEYISALHEVESHLHGLERVAADWRCSLLEIMVDDAVLAQEQRVDIYQQIVSGINEGLFRAEDLDTPTLKETALAAAMLCDRHPDLGIEETVEMFGRCLDERLGSGGH